MDLKGYRRLTAAVSVSLVAVAVLSGFGPAFPRDVTAGTAWHALVTDYATAAHVLLGVVTLAGAVALVATAPRRLPPGLVLLGVVLSVAAGAWYVTARQPDAALTTMTLGWLLAVAASATELVRTRRRRIRQDH